MRAAPFLTAIALLLPPALLAAQADAPGVYNEPRAKSYLFAATASDARAIWVNPAGLAIFPEASVMASFVVDRKVLQSSYRLGQYTLGFNARGLAFAYQRDRFDGNVRGNTFSFGLGTRLNRGSIGSTFTLYRGGGAKDQGTDFGFRYLLLPGVDLGLVVRNVGRPVVRSVKLPITWVGAIGWAAPSGVIKANAEGTIAERVLRDGYDVTYRVGLELATPGRTPIGAILVLDLGSNLKADRVNFGLIVGAKDQGVALASLIKRAGTAELERISLSGISTRLRPGRGAIR